MKIRFAPGTDSCVARQSLTGGLGNATAKRFGVRATVPNYKSQEVTTLGAFERPHLVPSGNQRDLHDDPFDIASDALQLGIHGAPAVHS